ncbi:NACHT domain-containing protein, partial [Leptodontidium sp. MPI-SDFR-AT-0119]
MRLLQYNNDGDLSLTEFDESDSPEYAILSHTWEQDNSKEVTYAEVISGTGHDKEGFKKIKFCGEQARQDSLSYFWVDTCCINKQNKAELRHSINSMFRWYRNASRCYVYLSDVSTRKRKASDLLSEHTWELSFRDSRWFTRGWTLQELLAPASVEFFSFEGKRLGDKSSLQTQICKATNISPSALQAKSLSQFHIDERMQWIEHRETGKEEDKAYSLLGIFGVSMVPAYGEGVAKAFDRLWNRFREIQKCMQDLRPTDPRLDKQRIEATKGGLLQEAYRWVIETSDFQQWCTNQHHRLLWIKGDPGKGKTMLLCGIADELQNSLAKSALLSYFFCQATDSRINRATAVLRGLIYLLVDQQPSLVSHVQASYDEAGKALFEDANAWVALAKVFSSILHDPNLVATYLIVDALDECVVDLPNLLCFITQTSSVSTRVKWVVSSRNWPEIEKRLDTAMQKQRLCLELNADSVSTAVVTFIQTKVHDLREKNKYTSETRDVIQQHLSLNAHGTFLWVALASEDSELCMNILAVVSTVYRPITIDELVTLVKMPNGVDGEYEALAEIIGYCRSFLAIRERTIFFVHQSANDFLIGKAPQEPLLLRAQDVHNTIFSRSLQVMSITLRRDIYNLRAPGISIDQVEPPDPNPLAAIRYSCLYWVDHLLGSRITKDSVKDLKASSSVYKFLHQYFLYWLEALSLLKSVSEGVVMIRKLENLQFDRNPDLRAFIHDARRFIVSNRSIIEQAPLQAYCSALVFAPEKSIVREMFEKYIPSWIQRKPRVEAHWNAMLQTLEGHSD